MKLIINLLNFIRDPYRINRLEDALDREVWCNAGCLTYAEGYKTRAPLHLENEAMRQVWALRRKYEELYEAK